MGHQRGDRRRLSPDSLEITLSNETVEKVRFVCLPDTVDDPRGPKGK